MEIFEILSECWNWLEKMETLGSVCFGEKEESGVAQGKIIFFSDTFWWKMLRFWQANKTYNATVYLGSVQVHNYPKAIALDIWKNKYTTNAE